MSLHKIWDVYSYPFFILCSIWWCAQLIVDHIVDHIIPFFDALFADRKDQFC